MLLQFYLSYQSSFLTEALHFCRESPSRCLIHANVHLYPITPLPAFLGLMHLLIALTAAALRRAWHSYQPGFDDHPVTQVQTLGGKTGIDLEKQLPGQIMALKQATKITNPRRIRQLITSSQQGKSAHHWGIIQCLFLSQEHPRRITTASNGGYAAPSLDHRVAAPHDRS